ncbi:MAG: 3-deoxy-7-phosphoheptulonate synthase, partial [Gemmatimonadaceae bacterium]|nr:3-deoxy-7-phosphoheptulonate synthase [Gemmatimonadaceae bacterium]
MLIITTPDITPAALDHLVERVEGAGLRAHVIRGAERIVIGCIGDDARLRDLPLAQLEGVAEVVPVLKPYRLAAREYAAGPTRVALGDAARTVIGGQELVVIAGPCSVEGRAMLHDTADAVRASGARCLRGGAYKPRSSPWAFQGLGEEALALLVEVRARTGMPVVTEVMDTRQVELVASHADMLQIGARNMQNFALLSEVGRAQRPVLLKRGLSATVTELLQAAEYVMAQGNRDVVLCERGIRTYETSTRNTLDVGAIAVLKRETHLPVLVDPSHAAGRAPLVAPLAMAAIACGADGLLVEVHPDPATARSDGEQSLTFAEFDALMRQAVPFAQAAG